MSDIDLLKQGLTAAEQVAGSNALKFLFQPESCDISCDDFGQELVAALLRLGMGNINPDNGYFVNSKWCFKFETRAEPLFLFTDVPQRIGKWADGTAKVFPWPDEADLIIRKLDGLLKSVPKNGRVMDLCCGSGTIGLWMARMRPDIRMIFVDVATEALEQTKQNALLNFSDINRFEFLKSNVFSDVSEKFDLIVADPPFFPTPYAEFAEMPDSGGIHCDRISQLVLEQSNQFLSKEGSLGLLSYSLGNGSNQPDQLRISKFIASLVGSFRHIDASSRLLRFGHRKIFAMNPLPLEYLVLRLGDPFRREYIWDLPYEQQCERADAFINWIANRKDDGWSHLHYVWGVFHKRI